MRQGFQWPYTLSPYDTGMLIEDVWPTLFFGVERLEEIRRKVDCLPWAKDVLSQMRAEAEVVVTQPPLLPESKIGWRHDFYSHTSAEHLVYDPESPGQFLDPLDQSWHTSQAQREAWVLLTHERTFRMMRSLGVLYGITGDERFAAWVADGVKRAARFFMRADLREGNRFNALYFHPLYDSQTLMLLANAYSLTRDSGFYSVADQEAVATNIFENGMPSQMRFLDETGAHNMTAYVAASLVLAGTVLGREDWRKRGLYDSQGGVPALLRDGLRTDRNGQVDGFWFEGTMFYHFYTICPMVAAFEGLKADGTPDADLFERFEKMFEAPVLLCDQELRLPCLGDLGSPGARSLSVYRHLYEYAAGQFESDLYERALSEIYGRGVSRNSLSALAYGPDEVRPKRLSRRSTVLKASGVAMFRGKTKEGSFDLMFRSGPHGAGHDHPDKLSIDLRAFGEVIAPDLGTAGYAVEPIHAFYRSTLSHNTLMVDEQNQARAERCSLKFRSGAREATGILEDAYEGVRLERFVRFEPPLVYLEDRFVSEDERRFGWVFHARGGMVVRSPERAEALDLPPLPVDGPFAWFTNRHTQTVAGRLCVDWQVGGGVWLRLQVRCDDPFEVTTGQTPGNPIPDGKGTVFLRSVGRERVFRTVLEVHRGCPSLAL